MSLSGLLILTPVGLLLYFVAKQLIPAVIANGKSIENESLKEFERELKKLKNGDIKVFTNEHPYVWVENTVNEAREKIKASCPKSRYGISAAQANYQLKINEKAQHVFVALNTNSKEEWPELKLYKEWLESNRQVAENISKYREAQEKNA